MATQEALVPDPTRIHIWRRFIDDGAINHAQWLRARSEAGFVGECTCGGYLSPREPEELAGRTDYAAECSRCGKEVNAPNGRLRRPGRPRSGT